MAKRISLSLIVLSLFAFFMFSSAQITQADVRITQMNISSEEADGFRDASIIIGPGSGDFDLIVCSIETQDGPNPFNLPTPGSWTELDNSPCVGPECQLGIWTKGNVTPNSEFIDCNWPNLTNGFAAGSIRYQNVDPNDPIIDMACSVEEGDELVIGPVSSEPGAQLVFISTALISGDNLQLDVVFNSIAGDFTVSRPIENNRRVFLSGTSALDADGVGFPGIVLPDIGPDVFERRACVLTIRMATRNVPTMSEWGLIGFAALAGIAGVWYLRRRQVTA